MQIIAENYLPGIESKLYFFLNEAHDPWGHRRTIDGYQ